DSDSPSAPARVPSIQPARRESIPQPNTTVPPPFSRFVREGGNFRGTHPTTKSETSAPRQSTPASPFHSRPTPQTPIPPAVTCLAHKSDQTISQIHTRGQRPDRPS